jgi:hypothetical protein
VKAKNVDGENAQKVGDKGQQNGKTYKMTFFKVVNMFPSTPENAETRTNQLV